MKNLFRFSIISCFLYFNLATLSAQSNPKYINKFLLHSDVNFMVKNFEDIQVNCYLHISKKTLIAKKDSIFKTLPQNVPIKKAFITINQIAAFLKDTHTYVENDNHLFEEYKHAKLFPLKLEIDDNKNIHISQNLVTVGKLAVGQTIIDINGVPASKLFQQSIDMQGGLLNYQISEAINYFSYNLFLLDVHAPFIISYRNASSEISYDTISGISYTDYQKANQIKPVTKYNFTLLNENIGYIDFRSMSGDLNHFKKFLDSSFSILRNVKAKGLIVDLRYNGGGDSEYGELLLSYLTEKSFRLTAGRRFKVSQHYQQFMKMHYPDQSSQEVKNYQTAKPGTILTLPYQVRKYFMNNPNRYQLKTCFLIGPQNLSSATMLADGAQTYRIATLIGEPTGAPANDGGESYNFNLPYSNFKISTSSAYDIRANGNERDNKPILPDIFIKEKKSEGIDEILKAGVVWINKAKVLLR